MKKHEHPPEIIHGRIPTRKTFMFFCPRSVTKQRPEHLENRFSFDNNWFYYLPTFRPPELYIKNRLPDEKPILRSFMRSGIANGRRGMPTENDRSFNYTKSIIRVQFDITDGQSITARKSEFVCLVCQLNSENRIASSTYTYPIFEKKKKIEVIDGLVNL